MINLPDVKKGSPVALDQETTGPIDRVQRLCYNGGRGYLRPESVENAANYVGGV